MKKLWILLILAISLQAHAANWEKHDGAEYSTMVNVRFDHADRIAKEMIFDIRTWDGYKWNYSQAVLVCANHYFYKNISISADGYFRPGLAQSEIVTIDHWAYNYFANTCHKKVPR